MVGGGGASLRDPPRRLPGRGGSRRLDPPSDPRRYTALQEAAAEPGGDRQETVLDGPAPARAGRLRRRPDHRPGRRPVHRQPPWTSTSPPPSSVESATDIAAQQMLL